MSTELVDQLLDPDVRGLLSIPAIERQVDGVARVAVRCELGEIARPVSDREVSCRVLVTAGRLLRIEELEPLAQEERAVIGRRILQIER